MELMDNLPCLDGSLFTWNGNVGSVEASDLPRTYSAWTTSSTGRRTAAFRVKSNRTGRELTFELASIEKDAEGEVLCQLYVAREKDVSIRVYND